MQFTQVALKNLNPGQEAPSGPVNARKASANGLGMGSIKSLAEHIKAVGIIVPLIVVRDERAAKDAEDLHVIDGGRRLAALRFLAKSKAPGWTAETKIPVMLRGQLPISALETSMATAAFALPHHPVDRFEAYAAMTEHGVTVDDIAARYSVEKPAVRQALRLAGLHPAIRQHWREGKITADVAEAFLGEPNPDKQIELYESLSKSRSLYRGAITQALKADPATIARVLKFVGRAEYEKAGGAVLSNLFSEGDSVSDRAALDRLAMQKLGDRADQLRRDGWGWVEHHIHTPSDLFRLDHTWPAKGKFTKEQRAAAGVMVFIGQDGKIQEERGLLKPGAKDPTKTAGKASSGKETGVQKPKKKPGEVSAALERRLRENRIMIARRLLEDYGRDFIKTDQPKAIMCDVIVNLIGESPFYGMPAAVERALPAILDVLPSKAVNTYIATRFDAADYFAGISRDQRVTAVREAMTKEHADKVAKMKASDQIKFCIENVFRAAGWLPPQMRTAHYKGPGVATKTKRGRK